MRILVMTALVGVLVGCSAEAGPPNPAEVVQYAADEHYMSSCREVSAYVTETGAAPEDAIARYTAEAEKWTEWPRLTDQQRSSVTKGIEAGAWKYCLPA